MKIKDVSEKFNIPSPTLRYYEKIGLIEPVPKVGSQREYGENHLDQIYFIQCMKKTGLTLDDIHSYVTLYLQGRSSALERLAILEKQKQKTKKIIEELQETIAYIDKKMAETQSELEQK